MAMKAGTATITAKECAEVMGTSKRLVYRLCADGTIKAARMGDRWIIGRAAFFKQIGIEDPANPGTAA